jgi:hypothetical protein
MQLYRIPTAASWIQTAKAFGCRFIYHRSYLLDEGDLMAVSLPGLFIVLSRFPERKDCVKRLFEEDDNFRSVCEDYRNCAEAVQYWNQSESEEASVRREEYAAILRDLEGEILEFLGSK